ncbi:ABC transporter permease [Labilibaculum sp.]|uniref:ABC transporter permease n=1 Tax=Labilibaculum sp. TaxID=2060723 RepID=UPI002AA7EB38|nr:FtsX-like permease family protein [Labilibaculum sp.]
MNFYNIKLSLKGLLKNRVVSAINIGGLALGISISLLIFAFVDKEESMDKHIAKSDNIFVLKNDQDSYVSSKMVELIRMNIPEIKHITYAQNEWSPQVFVEYNNKKIKIKHLIVTDSAFFRVLPMKALYGNPSTALTTANKIVLTETLSKKIFGNENPIGKTITYNATNLQNELIVVGAVIKDLSHNSSFKFDAVLSEDTNNKIDWYAGNKNSWGTQNYISYFRIPTNSNINLINQKLKNIPLTDVAEDIKSSIKLSSLPLQNSYFKAPDIEIQRHGNHLTIIIIRITGILILLLACINYINLVATQKIKRLRNIGILKVLGSKRRKIIQLISTESGLVLLITSALVITLLYFLTEGLNHLTQSQFTLAEILSGWNLIVFILILIVTLLITGIIPGIILSSNETTQLLKNKISINHKNYLRNILLVFQFTISIILITSILFIKKQNNFLISKDPGFKRENIIYTTTNEEISNLGDAFQNEMKKIAGVEDITFSSSVIGYNESNWGRDLLNKTEQYNIGFSNFYVAPNFFKFFGIELVRGKQFNEYSSKARDWIFNQTAIKKFRIEQLEDAKLLNWSGTKQEPIIAEVTDFNFESMHVPIRPVGFRCRNNVDEVAYFKLITTNGMAFKQCLSAIQKKWTKLSPKFPLEIKFMNSSWEALYTKEKQFQKILNYATAISILLSCLGLISLTFFIVETQTKEIGLRKVNGAKPYEIVQMLNKGFAKWVVIAFVIACPIAWYAMHKWLENFAYKTELSWWIFALAGLIAMGIALLTVSFQSWRAATRNPVESLRYE